MHSTAFFKTKPSSILPRLKSKQINKFCNVKKIKSIKKIPFFKVEAARRATSKKKDIVIF